jgi:hypothetical protein
MITCYRISMYLYICIVAPHLGTLAETREGYDVELTWCWWTYLGDGRRRQVLDWGNARQANSPDKL